MECNIFPAPLLGKPRFNDHMIILFSGCCGVLDNSLPNIATGKEIERVLITVSFNHAKTKSDQLPLCLVSEPLWARGVRFLTRQACICMGVTY